MTKEEIIDMACQSFGGVIKKEERDNFIAFAKLVTEKEREECAKVCDAYDNGRYSNAADLCAESIRARGQIEQ